MAQNSPFIVQPPVPASVARLGLQVNSLDLAALDAIKAAGGTLTRTQFSWSAVEPYGSTAYALPTGGEAWLAGCAQRGISPILVAAYGPPWTLVGTLTLTSPVAIGDTVLHVNTGGILGAINPPFCHVTGGANGIVGIGTGKWAYYGALIDSVNPGAGTLTLATPAVEAIANGATLTVNRLKYASLATQDPTSPGAVAYAAYVAFLAQRIAAYGKGYVCLWNEPPWANDSWHARGYFYATPPVGVTAGVVGVPALVQACLGLALPDGVRLINDGTDKTGFASISTLTPQVTAAQISSAVSYESFHPYSDSPEGYGWDRTNPISTLFGGPGAYENLVTGDTGNFGWLDRQDDLFSGAVGARPQLIATETGAAYSDDTRQAVWLLRRVASLWGMNVPANVYDLRDGGTYDVTTGAGTTYTPRLSYLALQRLMAIVGRLGSAGSSPVPIPTVLSAGSSPWQVMATGLYGAGGLLLIWQRTVASPWVSLSAPGTWPVEIRIPQGYAIAEATDLLTGSPVAVSSTTGAVSVPVGESVVAIRTTRAPGPLNLLALGRLTLPTVKDDFKEGVGEALETTGAGVALGQRRPKLFGLTIPLKAQPDGSSTDYAAAGDRMRRQLRSMLQNPILRGLGIYLAFIPDSEIDGWVMIGNGQIAYDQGNVVFGNFTLTLDEIYRVATLSTHRPGLRFVNTDRRLTTTPRDYRQQLFSIDFAGLPILALNGMPGVGPGVGGLDFEGGTYRAGGSWTGPDGTGYLAVNALDGDVVSFEQTEASRFLGQVVAYDRRGHLTAPSSGPDPLWEEVYGPDFPWSWQSPGQPADAPVLANDRCRVRFDGVSMILRVDAWVSNAWAEQCQVVIQRYNPSVPALYTDDTFQAARLVEYTGERAVMLVVLSSASDVASREEVYVTLQRGWQGPRVEIYPSPTSAGVVCGAALTIVSATVDANDSAVKIDTTAAITATAGSGSAYFPGGNLGAATFTGENEVILLRQGQATSINVAVLQAGVNCQGAAASAGFGAARNAILLLVAGGGYLTAQLGFPAQQTDQILEAEAIRNTVSGTTSIVADATASGGSCVKDTQTTRAANTVVKSPANLIAGAKYRVLMRVKVDAGAIGTFGASTNSALSTLTPSTTSTTWTWVDCGDLVNNIALSSIAGAGWRSAGTGGVYIDRVESVKLEDRATAQPLWDGGRDLGQAFLTDARALPVQVER